MTTTNGVLTTITMPDGTVRKVKLSSGLKSDIRQGTAIMLYSRDESTMDLLRQSFFVETAQGSDLTCTLGTSVWAAQEDCQTASSVNS